MDGDEGKTSGKLGAEGWRRSLENRAEDGDAVIEEATSDRPLRDGFGGDAGGVVEVGLLAFADLAGEGGIVDEEVIFVV